MLGLTVYLSALETKEEQDKLEMIYQRYYASMRSTARRYVGQYSVDEDIVHEAILSIIENLEMVDLSKELRTKCFVCTITANKAKDWLKHEQKLQITDVDNTVIYDEDIEQLPVESVLSKEGYQRLIKCICELGEIYHDVCMLRYVSELRVCDIAKVLNLEEKTVSARLSRAKRMLKEKIINERIVEGKL